jgi:mannosyltransferase OCH1-like enzyme
VTKEIHRFWAGRSMPEAYRDYEVSWKALNPDWEVKTWGMEVLDTMPEYLLAVINDIKARDAGRNGIEMFVQIADVVGYWLVYKYGCAYFNCDIQPVRPLPDPMPDMAWASLENDTEKDVVNAAIGAPHPENIFWGRLLLSLPDWYFGNPGAQMVLTTGPSLLTHHAREFSEDIHVFSRTTFNPVHWGQVARGGDASGFLDSIPEDTIGVHHWGHKRDGRSNVVETATQ